jgi:ribonuclease T2
VKTVRFLQLCIATFLLAACSQEAGGDADKPQYVLAFSWQPAFCETAPRKPECRSQTVDRFDARHFSLHGLWPQKTKVSGSTVYCGVPQKEIDRDKSGRWRDLDAARISEIVWQELRRVMPGTRSGLHKHEWVKHGTCYGGSDIDAYYADSLKLMAWLNASSLRWRFEATIGQQLTGKDIREAFDRDFGRGAGERLRISCKRDRDTNRNLIVELTLGLAGDIAAATSLSDLVMAAPETNPGCPGGLVDAAGFQ